MQESIQKSCQLREARIEALYVSLSEVKNADEKLKILQEIETVTGVKLIYGQSSIDI
ncbi:hypothetical protein PN498_08685 [Oscillatoria sp. CS-180]|uniref:hypothetical protein n=1 Tax=Oscillatoria sp. CS-180 TaxID=3021720 RepID=UPI002330FE6D|nr:hypothetical protein [Oscillatoria sp. CS-180]MDB9526060.1 hypothetical protein [Oscillatoria sp. CS-180]